MDTSLKTYIESLSTKELINMKNDLIKEIERMKEHDAEHTKKEFLPKYEEELSFINEVLNSTWNVYSSMLGGFVSMGLQTKEEAQKFIEDYHDNIEKKRMSVSRNL